MLHEFSADWFSTVACCLLDALRTFELFKLILIYVRLFVCLLVCASALMSRVFHPSGPGSYDPVESW